MIVPRDESATEPSESGASGSTQKATPSKPPALPGSRKSIREIIDGGDPSELAQMRASFVEAQQAASKLLGGSGALQEMIAKAQEAAGKLAMGDLGLGKLGSLGQDLDHFRSVIDSIGLKSSLLSSIESNRLLAYERPDYSWLANSYVSPEARSQRLEARIEALQDEVSELRQAVEHGDPELRQRVAQIDLRVARLTEDIYHDNEPQDETP